MQYLDTGWVGILVTCLIVAFVLTNIKRAKGKSDLYVRPIPGLAAIDEAIGRATEMGRPILMIPGLDTLNAVSVQAINIFANVARKAAKFGTPIRLCCADAAVFTVAQEVIRDVYAELGLQDKMDEQTVQFVSDRQFAFAAAVQGMILRDQVAATFLLGAFYAESLIFAESANSIGAIQIAGSTQNTQTPFFIAACDYVLIGDEYYAASAYITREPVLVGSLIGQDFGKMMVIGMILIGSLMVSGERMQKQGLARIGETVEIKGQNVDIESMTTPPKPVEHKKGNETSVYRFFNPLITKEMLDVQREQEPPKPDAPSPTGGSL